MRMALLPTALIALISTGPMSPCAAQTPNRNQSVSERQTITDGWRKRWLTTMEQLPLQPVSAGNTRQSITATMVGREDLVPHVSAWAESPECVPLDGDPFKEIVRRAKETNVVVIDEQHDNTDYRAFVTQVIEVLRPLGYNVFAMPFFFPGADLDHPGVLLSDGYYTAEPELGRELELAKQLGYRIVSIALSDEQEALPTAELRLRASATNIKTAIFEGEPSAKVIIHTGAPKEDSLKAVLGVDPLTIRQTDCRSPGSRIVLSSPPAPGDAAKRADLYIGHPMPVLKDGRPARRQQAGQKPVAVPKALLNLKRPVIIEARPTGSSLQKVPADRLYLRPGERLPLLLYPGSYRIDAWTVDGLLDGSSLVVPTQ